MSIVKMKRLRVMALAGDKPALLAQLLHLGCVEIESPEGLLSDPSWAALLSRGDTTSSRGAITEVNAALAAIRKYGKLPDGLFIQRGEIGEAKFLSTETAQEGKTISDRIGALLQEYARLQGEENHLRAQRGALTPWQGLDLPLETPSTEHVLLRLAVCPAGTDFAAMEAELAGQPAVLLAVNTDREQQYLVLLCHRAEETAVMELLRPHGISLTAFKDTEGTAAENMARLDRTLEENATRQTEVIAEIAAHKEFRDELRLYADRLTQETSLETSSERILTDGSIVFFEGWAPAAEISQLETLFTKLGCAWETEDPTEEDYPNVPVQLKNNVITRPLNMVTEMYSLPAYNGIDPNPLMAPFFILFYGVMMADMGYGLLMMLASLVVLKKYRPKYGMQHFFSLLGLCGISTFIMGAITGGFFGDFPLQLARVINPETTFAGLPALFTPLDDTLAILVGSMALGGVQILTGMIISFVKQTREGHFLDALMDIGSWWLVFIGVAVGALGGTWLVAIAGVVALICTQGRHSPTLMGKLVGGIGSLYDITGYFGDVLSYSRLMALMLAGSVIAQVFNTLGAIPGNVIIFLVISMAGNALNFALNLLGCYVHDLRLQCLEYFGKFYQDGGKAFKPLEIKTKFVDVVKE
ncbi:MAG: V-type ATP synthase subunit I [Oscillospiraceae bacterium]